jgi:hypothetical protein
MIINETACESGARRPLWAVLLGLNLLASLLMMLAMHAPAKVAVPPTYTAGWDSSWIRLDETLKNVGAERWGLATSFGLAVICYACSIAIAIRRGLTTQGRTIVLATLLIALPLLALPRLLSSDVYLYASYGRMLVVHGQNPFFHTPAEFAGDPLLGYTLWSNLKSVYGPIWLIVSAAVTRLVLTLGGSAAGYVMGFKLLALACHLTNTWLISQILKETRPAAQTWGTILYAWNPFVLMELVGSAHNDGLTITFVLLGCLMEVRGRRILALVAFVCAGLVKLPGGLVAPAYVMYVAWQRAGKEIAVGAMARALAVQAAVGMATVILFYAPFWRGPATMGHLSGGPNFNKLLNSPAARVYWALQGRLCRDEPRAALDAIDPETGAATIGPCRQRLAERVRKASLGLFGVVYLGLILFPMRTRHAFFERALWIFLMYCLIAAYDFHPWYILWVMAMAPLTERARWMLWAGCCAVFVLYVPMRGNHVVSVAFLPVMAAIIVEVARGWRLKTGWRGGRSQAVVAAGAPT